MSNDAVTTVTVEIAGTEISFETGKMARQAGGAVVVRAGDSMILSTATVGNLRDRPIRPLFPKSWRYETQLVTLPLSVDHDEPFDILAMNGASAALMISEIPLPFPVGAVRIGKVDGNFVVNPTEEQLLGESELDLIVAGSEHAILMVEAGADGVSEAEILDALDIAHAEIKKLCAVQHELREKAGKAKMEIAEPADLSPLVEEIRGSHGTQLDKATQVFDKLERQDATQAVKEAVVAQYTPDEGDADYAAARTNASKAFSALEKQVIRQRIAKDKKRPDGRQPTEIRPITIEVGLGARNHGSALFTRGQTQAYSVATLGTLKEEMRIDTLGLESKKFYWHHYNFPPYSTGETGRVGSPKRREIGHGALAERALLPVLPSRADFPYAIRQVSEALSSNGSTSMGSVCASTMSLLNAGVPLKAPVAGIAMGLVFEGGEYAALTDILGAEDAFGDMDFKVAGTKDFVTALQLDTKLDGIPSGVLADALQQARTARLAILEVMNEAIDAPDEMSPFAPRVLMVKIPVDKIGEVIGPKGKMINQIQADTGADISVEDDGTIYIGATDGPSAEAALATVNMIANPTMPKVGERFLGTVVKTAPFGAFVSLLPGKDGLVHISKLGSGKRIGKVEDVVNVGDKLQVEITEIDQRGKISLTPVEAAAETGAAPVPVAAE